MRFSRIRRILTENRRPITSLIFGLMPREILLKLLVESSFMKRVPRHLI
jgi:hypothetical protein